MPSDFRRRRDVKVARKHRSCDWCSKWIKKGQDSYTYFVGRVDGDWRTSGYCITCTARFDDMKKGKEDRA